MQDLETLAVWGLASGPEACAQHDSRIEDQQQTQEQKWRDQWLRCLLKLLLGRAPHYLHWWLWQPHDFHPPLD